MFFFLLFKVTWLDKSEDGLTVGMINGEMGRYAYSPYSVEVCCDLFGETQGPYRSCTHN